MALLRYLSVLLLLLPSLLNAAEHLVTLEDDSEIKVFVFYPQDQGEGPWPLCVLLPGGKANEYVARAQFWLGKELTERGWAIAVPVAPDSSAFFGHNAEKIPEVIERLQSSSSIHEGKSLLVGISNGGSSALEIATRHPENYLGVVAMPGILKEETPVATDLQELPVFIRIGENDFLGWQRRLPAMRERLTEAGAEVNASLVPNARHVVPLGWDELDPWLESLD